MHTVRPGSKRAVEAPCWVSAANPANPAELRGHLLPVGSSKRFCAHHNDFIRSHTTSSHHGSATTSAARKGLPCGYTLGVELQLSRRAEKSSDITGLAAVDD